MSNVIDMAPYRARRETERFVGRSLSDFTQPGAGWTGQIIAATYGESDSKTAMLSPTDMNNLDAVGLLDRDFVITLGCIR